MRAERRAVPRRDDSRGAPGAGRGVAGVHAGRGADGAFLPAVERAQAVGVARGHGGVGPRVPQDRGEAGAGAEPRGAHAVQAPAHGDGL